jgi:hypothetical protein
LGKPAYAQQVQHYQEIAIELIFASGGNGSYGFAGGTET